MQNISNKGISSNKNNPKDYEKDNSEKPGNNSLFGIPAKIVGLSMSRKNYLKNVQKVSEISLPNNSGPPIINGKIAQLYNSINDLIIKVKENINLYENFFDKVLERQEKEYIIAYKAEMLNIKNQLSTFKNSINTASIEAKKNEEIDIASKSIAWFKNETMRLHEENKKYKNDFKTLNEKIQNYKNENKFFRTQIKKARQDYKNIESENVTLRSFRENQSEMEVQFQPCLTNYSNMDTKVGQASEKFGEAKISEKISNFFSSFPDKIENDILPVKTKSKEFIQCLKSLKLRKMELFQKFEEYIQKIMEKYNKLHTSCKYQLEIKDRELNKLRSFISQKLFKKFDMEQLFYECIEKAKLLSKRRRLNQIQRSNLNQTMINENLLKGTQLLSTDKIKILDLLIGDNKFLQKVNNIIFHEEKLCKTSHALNLTSKHFRNSSLVTDHQTFKTPNKTITFQKPVASNGKQINDKNSNLQLFNISNNKRHIIISGGKLRLSTYDISNES